MNAVAALFRTIQRRTAAIVRLDYFRWFVYILHGPHSPAERFAGLACSRALRAIQQWGPKFSGNGDRGFHDTIIH